MTALEMVFSIWLFLHRLKSKVRALSENEFNRMLYDMPCVKTVPAFVLEKKNEGFKTASKVQYVASAGCFEKERLRKWQSLVSMTF